MGSDNSSTGRHTARKNAARDLAARTGMTYTAALRQVAQPAKPRLPRHRWVLTDDVRAWFAGVGWRGVAYPNLYDWLDDDVSPTYECDWCGEPGDAREVDSSIGLVIAAYDPDLAPATVHLVTYKHHAGCKSSSISWAHKVDLPAGPQRIGLPASIRPDLVAEFDVDAWPLLARDGRDERGSAVLLVTARVVEDHQQGVRPWLHELELHLNGEGFVHPDSLGAGPDPAWALRVVTDYPSALAPQWIALRTGPADNGAPPHLLLRALDLPSGWVEAARRDARVVAAIGPCTAHWDVAAVPGALLDEIDDLLDDPVPGLNSCRCAALTAEHVAELVDAGVFVTGPVRVVAAGEED